MSIVESEKIVALSVKNRAMLLSGKDRAIFTSLIAEDQDPNAVTVSDAKDLLMQLKMVLLTPLILQVTLT